METTDQKTIVKRIALSWKVAKDLAEHAINGQGKMLAYRYALENCGLTLNEIIALGDADNLDEAIDVLFVKNGQKN